MEISEEDLFVLTTLIFIFGLMFVVIGAGLIGNDSYEHDKNPRFEEVPCYDSEGNEIIDLVCESPLKEYTPCGGIMLLLGFFLITCGVFIKITNS